MYDPDDLTEKYVRNLIDLRNWLAQDRRKLREEPAADLAAYQLMQHLNRSLDSAMDFRDAIHPPTDKP